MGTDNPLAVMQDLAVATADDVFDAVASSNAYLPRLQLMTANSEKCKDGSFPTNHYARVNDSDQKDMGTDVDVLVCAFRALAIETTDEGSVITSYDVKSETFQRIQAKADQKGMNGAMYGPQFLVWVASEQEFMTFFMASITARKASPSVKALMLSAGTLGSKKIESKDYTWFGPTCIECTTPFEMPTEDDARKVITEFVNPPEPTVEVVSDDAAGDDARE